MIYRCWVAVAIAAACAGPNRAADPPRTAKAGVHIFHDRVVAFVDAQLQVLADLGDWQGDDISIAFLRITSRWDQAWKLTRNNFDRGERVVVVPTYNLPWEKLDLDGAALDHARTPFPRTPITTRKIGVPELLHHLDEQGVAVVGIGFSSGASFVLQENASLLVDYAQQQARAGGNYPSNIVINSGGITAVAHADRLREAGYDVKQTGERALVTAVEQRFADFDPIGLRIPALGVLGYVGNAVSQSGEPFGQEEKHGYAAFRGEVNRALVDAVGYNTLVKGLTGSEAPLLDALAEMQRGLDRQVALDRSVQRALIVHETLNRIQKLIPQGSIRKELIVNTLDKIEHDRIQQNRGEIIRTVLDRIKAERNRLTAGENKRTLVVLPRQRGAILRALRGKEEDLRIVEQTDRVVRRYVGHMRWSIVEYKTSEDAFLIYDATGEDTDEARENVLEMVEKLDESGVIMVGNPDSPAYKQLRDAFKDAGVEINGEVSTKGKSKEEILRDIVQLHEKVGGIVVERKDLAVVDDPTPDPQELEYEIEETDEGWKITFRIGDVPVWEMILDEDGNVICEGPPGTCDGGPPPDNYREPREPKDRMKQEEKQQEVENSDVGYDVEKRKDGTIQITITINDVPVWEIVLDKNGNIVCQGPPGWCNGDGGAPAPVGPLVPVPDPVTDFRLPDKPCDSDPILAWIPHVPTLDRLATLGLRFSPAFSVNPLCSPTRATLLASRLNGATPEALRRPTIAARSFSRSSCQGLFADISSTPVGADVFREHVLPITRFSRAWPNVATVPPAPNRPATAMDGLSQLRSCLAVSSVAMADTGVMPCRIWLTGMLLADESIQAGDRIETLSDAPVMSGETTRGVVRAGTHLSAQKVSGNWVLITVEQSGQKLHGWIDVENVAVLTEEEAIFALVSRGEVWLMKGEYDKAIADNSEAIEINPNCDWAFASRGEAWRMKDEYDKAVTDLTKAIEIDPNCDRAFANRGEVWRMKNEYDKAIADLTKAIEINPNHVWAFASRGEVWRMKNEYDKAIADLTKAIEINPNHVWAFAVRGEVWRMKGEYDKAVTDSTKAIEINPNCDTSFANRGLAWQMKDEYDKAIADLTKAIEINPNHDWGFVNRGLAWQMKGDYDEAIADLTKAIEINPNHDWAFAVRGEVWRMKGDYDKAIADCSRAIEIDPSSDVAFANRGLAWRMKDEYDKAVTDLTKAIEINPDHDWAFASRGAAWRMKGDYDKAIADCSRAIEIDPNYDFAFATRGTAWRMKDEYDKAVTDLTKAIEINPNHDWAFADRGDAWRMKGDYDKAIADCSRAIEIDPNYDFAFATRGTAWRMKGDYDKAFADWLNAIVINPTCVWVYDQLAQVWIEHNNFDKAMAVGDKVIAVAPDDTSSYLLRSFILHEFDRNDEALADAERVIQIAPDSAEGYTARANALHGKMAYKEAVSGYTKAIELAPKDGGLYVLRANARNGLADYDEAIADALQARAMGHKGSAGCEVLGNAWLGKGDYNRARAEYEEALELDPDSIRAYAGRAAVWIELGEPDKATRDCSRAIRLEPRYVAAYANRAAAWNVKGDYEKAIADCNSALQFNANSASVFNNRGNAWAHLGRMGEALADYDQVIRLAPTLARAYANRAHVKLALEDYEKAMADYERALELSPDLPNALVGRGAAKLARGDLDEAIADYDRVLERDPSYCPALLGRGAAKRAKRDFAGALVDFGEVIRVDPTIGEGYYARADVLTLTARHKEAVADFREAIRKGLAWSEAR